MKKDHSKELMMGHPTPQKEYGYYKPYVSFKSRTWVQEDYKFYILLTWDVSNREVYAHAFDPLSLDPLSPEVLASEEYLTVVREIMDWCQRSRLHIVGFSK